MAKEKDISRDDGFKNHATQLNAAPAPLPESTTILAAGDTGAPTKTKETKTAKEMGRAEAALETEKEKLIALIQSSIRAEIERVKDDKKALLGIEVAVREFNEGTLKLINRGGAMTYRTGFIDKPKSISFPGIQQLAQRIDALFAPAAKEIRWLEDSLRSQIKKEIVAEVQTTLEPAVVASSEPINPEQTAAQIERTKKAMTTSQDVVAERKERSFFKWAIKNLGPIFVQIAMLAALSAFGVQILLAQYFMAPLTSIAVRWVTGAIFPEDGTKRFLATVGVGFVFSLLTGVILHHYLNDTPNLFNSTYNFFEHLTGTEQTHAAPDASASLSNIDTHTPSTPAASHVEAPPAAPAQAPAPEVPAPAPTIPEAPTVVGGDLTPPMEMAPVHAHTGDGMVDILQHLKAQAQVLASHGAHFPPDSLAAKLLATHDTSDLVQIAQDNHWFNPTGDVPGHADSVLIKDGEAFGINPDTGALHAPSDFTSRAMIDTGDYSPTGSETHATAVPDPKDAAYTPQQDVVAQSGGPGVQDSVMPPGQAAYSETLQAPGPGDSVYAGPDAMSYYSQYMQYAQALHQNGITDTNYSNYDHLRTLINTGGAFPEAGIINIDDLSHIISGANAHDVIHLDWPNNLTDDQIRAWSYIHTKLAEADRFGLLPSPYDNETIVDYLTRIGLNR